jgi:hypothetical protein
MRKNCRQTLNAFVAGKSARPAASIWTDGVRIFSYLTCIAERMPDGGILLNRTSYSVTTTIHQNALAAWMPGLRATLSDVPRNAGELARYR